MERNIHIDDFEDFLKDKADQYKMYPSDKVWDNIHKSVHPTKKWPYITLTLLLLLGTAIFVDTHNLVSINKKLAFNNDSFNKIAAVKHSSLRNITNAPVDEFIDTRKPEQTQTAPSFSTTTPQLTSTLASLNNTMAPDNNGILDNLREELTDSPARSSQPHTGERSKNQIEEVNSTAEKNQEVKKVLWGGEPFRKSKITWQMYFSPVVSYRRLSSDSREVTDVFRGVPYSITQESISVNNLVTHKPAIGAEVGANMVYKLADNFSLRAGLQLNYSRYQLRAYATKPEQATLAVVGQPMGADSINVISTLKNFSGNGSSWFDNEFFQLALPVGFEWGVLGNSTLQWNIAANVQPVYNFANNVYLLSADFKRYGQDASLIRKWNINAGAETYVSYNMGSFKWQAGPQLRYQLMSSYSNKYPVKEYLVDFGFKIGVTKTIR